MVVLSNVVGAVNELTAYIGIGYSKEFDTVGPVTARKFVCRVMFNGQTFTSQEFVSKDEALRDCCAKIIQPLPFIRVPDDCMRREGEGHVSKFRCQYENITTPWFSKLNDAQKHLMKMLVSSHIGSLDISLNNLSLAENSVDRQISRMVKKLADWQEINLPKIKMILGVKGGSELNAYLTAAFISPGFCVSRDERDEVSRFLGIPEYSFERLELLGDALIGLGSVTKFFDLGLGPGELSAHRSSLVCETALVRTMEFMGLNEYIILRDQYTAPSTKVVSDVFEAIVGAIYKASALDKEACAIHMLKFIVQ